MPKKNVNIKTIADAVGLSKTTVSYVLNGEYRKMNISEKTALLINKTAKSLGYRSNYWAKSLASQKSGLIGVVFPDLSNDFAHKIVKKMLEELEPAGYDILIGAYFWDPRRERKELELMLERRVEGLLAIPSVESNESFRSVIETKCPLVFICDYLPALDVPSVILDPIDSTRKILAHLPSIGRGKTALLSVDYPSKVLVEREKTFIASNRLKKGCNSHPLVFKSELADTESVKKNVRGIMSSVSRPDALICISDSIAYSALSELANMGIRVPEDVAVASYGDLPMSEHSSISLTTVVEPHAQIAEKAIAVLLERIETGKSKTESSRNFRLKGDLIVRHSTVPQ